MRAGADTGGGLVVTRSQSPSIPLLGGNQHRKATPELPGRLARNMKRLRASRGYTQERLGMLCRLHKNYISNIEQATVNISLANLETIARGLRCTANDLLRK